MSGILTLLFGEKCTRCGRRLHRGSRGWWFHQQGHTELDATRALQHRLLQPPRLGESE